MKKILFAIACFSAIVAVAGPHGPGPRFHPGPRPAYGPIRHAPHSHVMHGRDYGALGLGLGLGILGGALARPVVAPAPVVVAQPVVAAPVVAAPVVQPAPVVVTPAPVVATPVVQTAPVAVAPAPIVVPARRTTVIVR